MNRSNQNGIALLAVIAAILVGIAILLGLLVWSSSQNTLATTCQTNLATLQTQYNNWAAACASGDTITQARLVTSMNAIITAWNAGQCAKFGTLPAQTATCPPMQ